MKIMKDSEGRTSYETFESIKKSETTPRHLSWLEIFHLYEGIILGTCSGVSYSLVSLMVKYFSALSPGDITLSRSYIMSAFILPVIIYGRVGFYQKGMVLPCCWVGVVTSLSMYTRYSAFQILPLGDANVIVFSCPALVAILGRIFLKDKCNLLLVLSILSTIIGVVLVVDLPAQIMTPSTGTITYQTRGILLAIFSMILESVMCVILSAMKECHYAVTTFYMGLQSCFVTFIVSTLTNDLRVPVNCVDLWALLVIGALGFASNVFITKALQLDNAGFVSVARSVTDVLFAYMFEVVIFKEKPNVSTILGALLILNGGVLLNVNKWKLSKQTE